MDNCVYFIVIDVKLLTRDELIKIDDVVFPEETKFVANNNIINKANITIPGSIILSQFEIEGTYVYNKAVLPNFYSFAA